MRTVGLLIGKDGKPIEKEKADKLFTCPFCDKEYKTKKTLINHLKNEHTDEFVEEKKEEDNEREDIIKE